MRPPWGAGVRGISRRETRQRAKVCGRIPDMDAVTAMQVKALDRKIGKKGKYIQYLEAQREIAQKDLVDLLAERDALTQQ